jgi:hypothetical protein
MIGIMIIICYLLIGALLGCRDHELFDEILDRRFKETPTTSRKKYIGILAILVILITPIWETIYIFMLLKIKIESLRK